MNKRELSGISTPAIEECPECGSDKLRGTTISVNTTTIGLDGHGGISRWNDDVMQDTLIMSLDCIECGVALIEDSEVVHDDIH